MKEYGELLRNDRVYSEKANLFSVKVRDFAEFLSNMQLNTNFGSLRMKVTYQDPCHLVHGQGIRNEPREILGKIPGIELVEMEDSEVCCGFGGTFSVKFQEISTAMAEDKATAIAKTNAKYLVANDSSCLMQIGGYLSRHRVPVKPLHLADLLGDNL